jgi:hypothetical protein
MNPDTWEVVRPVRVFRIEGMRADVSRTAADPGRRNDGGLMGQDSHKHVGIYLGGDVWNDSNQAGQVLREQRADFIARIDKAYSGCTVVKYTFIPHGADFLSPLQVQDLAK